MQLPTRIETGGFDAWRRDFDAASEGRSRAGLSLLQIWRDADAPGTAHLLFEVRDRARDYLTQRDQLGHPLGAAIVPDTARRPRPGGSAVPPHEPPRAGPPQPTSSSSASTTRSTLAGFAISTASGKYPAMIGNSSWWPE